MIRVKRNANYHSADSVSIDEVVYYPVEDDGTSFKRFQAGELDIALKFPTDRIESVRKQYKNE